MTQFNESGACNSAAVAPTPTPPQRMAECALATDEVYWIRIEKGRGGGIIAKDRNGRVVFFERSARIPGWEPGRYTLVEPVFEKERYRVARPTKVVCSDTALDYRLARLFEFPFSASFEEPVDALVLECLANLTQDVYASEAFEVLLAQVSREEEERKRCFEAEQAATRARLEAEQKAFAGLTLAGHLWAKKWQALDWTAGYADDSMKETYHQLKLATLQVEAKRLTREEREQLSTIDWSVLATHAVAPRWHELPDGDVFGDAACFAWAELVDELASPAAKDVAECLARAPFRTKEWKGYMAELVAAVARIEDPAQLRAVIDFQWSGMGPSAGRAAFELRQLGK